MTSNDTQAVPAATGLILGVTLIAGMVIFVVFALLRGEKPSSPGLADWAPILVGAMGVVVIGLAALLPRRMAARVRSRSEEAREEIRAGKIPCEVHHAHLVAMAIAEGWGLFGTALFMTTGAPLTLVAPGVAVPLILLNIPTLDKARRALM